MEPTVSHHQQQIIAEGKYVTGLSIGLFVFLFVLSWLSGAVRLLWAPDPGTLHLTLRLDAPFWLSRIAEIVFWDISLFGVLFLVGTQGRGDAQRLDAMLALGLCLTLWRIVANNVFLVAFPASALDEVANLPTVNETLLILVPLIYAKETIFQNLSACDQQLSSPTLAALSWHHRKDAVFNALFGLVILTKDWGIPPQFCFLLTTVFKITLLGTATWAITRRAIHLLLSNPNTCETILRSTPEE